MEIQIIFCMYVCVFYVEDIFLVAFCNSVAYFCTTYFQGKRERKKKKLTGRERVNLLLFTGKKAG